MVRLHSGKPGLFEFKYIGLETTKPLGNEVATPFKYTNHIWFRTGNVQ